MNTERAVLGGGCFWGMQDLFRKQPGVVSTRVGYTGGNVAHATYRNHGTHAEAIEILFDPARTSYSEILAFFFQIHDPSTRNRQGNDVGVSYRSAIFYTSDEQRRIAEETIAEVDASGLWPGKVVTEVVPASDFWEAEPEHQDYLERYPNGYTCHHIRPDWKLPARVEAKRGKTGEAAGVSRRGLLAALTAGAALSTRKARAAFPAAEQVYAYTFNQDTNGWIPAMSDYSLSATQLRFTAEVRRLPGNFPSELRGYYLQSHNTPDDLFMYLKKELSSSDGVEADRSYGVSIYVSFLSNAPSGLAGIGGSPGENVYLKAGVSLVEPVAILEAEREFVKLNLDKGDQDQGGRDLQVVSIIANGQAPQENQPYVLLERLHHFPTVIRTDRRGVLWITVGIESGFEGLTGIYFYEIIVTLRPL
jgi:peptide-methionine (S)-S-oxide reductase